MLNLDKLCGEPSDVAFLTKLDAVMTHFGMKLSVGNAAGLHLANTCVRVVKRVNVEGHVGHEQSHHPAGMIEMPVSDNDVADFC
jgi:hypothetical protein